MDILLAHGYYLYEDPHELKVMKPYPTLGLLYLSSYLKSRGFSVGFFDATFSQPADFAARLERDRPAVVGLYCNLMTKRWILPMIQAAKAAGATVVLGGPEPPHYAEDYLARGTDVVVVGEGELTLEALLLHGGTDVALRWRDWLLRAVAGDPEDLQIMYGVAGERYLPERELPHLSGYLGSTPVRVGNAAAAQYQADVVGEVLIALAKLRDEGVAEDAFSWPLQRHLLGFVVRHADRPDQGLWEMRGPARFFTHSRVMMWAALDRGVRAVETHGLDGPVHEWASLRDRLRTEILTRGVAAEGGHFTQSYGSTEVDASLLQLPQTGFIAYDDPRMLATVKRIEEDLMHHGLLLRYRAEAVGDGLAGGEHPFLACSFWLVEQYARSGRLPDAVALLDSLVRCANDLGLLAEEYDPVSGLQMGNFPQAFSHLTLVRAADAVRSATGSQDHRRENR